MEFKTSLGIYIKSVSNQVIRFINHNSLDQSVDKSTNMQKIFCSFIMDNNPVYQKDLEVEFGIVPATASQILKKMEQEKLLNRVIDENDNRLKRLVLTKQGMEIAKMRGQELVDLDKAIIKNINKNDLKTFCKVLDQINQNVKF